MNTLYKTDVILAQLRATGLVVSERNTGKTTALVRRAAELAQHQPVIICSPSPAVVHYAGRLIDQNWQPGLDRPLLAGSRQQFDKLYNPDMAVLIDEYFYTNWAAGIPFNGAVGTPPFILHFSLSPRGL